jgi:KUP system potassium uptake protein
VEDEESVVVRTATAATDGNNSDTLQSLLQNMYESESRWFANRRRVRLDLKHAGEHVDPRMKKDLSAIVEAKHAGMLHIMDHSYIKEGRAPMCLRFAINNFLWKNCRCPERCGVQCITHQHHRSQHDLLHPA